jgi:hypothetical protein
MNKITAIYKLKHGILEIEIEYTYKEYTYEDFIYSMS